MKTTSGWMTTHNPQLRTSRAAADQERSVLSILRALAPRRLLTQREAFIVAELQANRLLELAGLPQTPIPSELITELPRIAVCVDPDLPVSGTAHWSSGRWQLTINGSEPWTRQRFSVCHELKHVIDHRYVDVLYSSDSVAEAVADHFAACLLMPKRDIKRLWGGGVQSLSALSASFGVSPAAMARRLEYLGLRTAPRRYPSAIRPHPRRKGRYTRSGSADVIGVSA